MICFAKTIKHILLNIMEILVELVYVKGHHARTSKSFFNINKDYVNRFKLAPTHSPNIYYSFYFKIKFIEEHCILNYMVNFFQTEKQQHVFFRSFYFARQFLLYIKRF